MPLYTFSRRCRIKVDTLRPHVVIADAIRSIEVGKGVRASVLVRLEYRRAYRNHCGEGGAARVHHIDFDFA